MCSQKNALSSPWCQVKEKWGEFCDLGSGSIVWGYFFSRVASIQTNLIWDFCLASHKRAEAGLRNQ